MPVGIRRIARRSSPQAGIAWHVHKKRLPERRLHTCHIAPAGVIPHSFTSDSKCCTWHDNAYFSLRYAAWEFRHRSRHPKFTAAALRSARYAHGDITAVFPTFIRRVHLHRRTAQRTTSHVVLDFLFTIERLNPGHTFTPLHNRCHSKPGKAAPCQRQLPNRDRNSRGSVFARHLWN